MTKYKAKKVVVTSDGTMFEMTEIKKYNLVIEGRQFDSKMEAEYYLELLLLKKEGRIRDFECQPKYVLQEKPKITYIADFLITDCTGKKQVVDVKGVETPAFRMKNKLFENRYPDLELKIITKNRGRWVPLDWVKTQKAERKKVERELLKRAKKG